MTGPAGEDREPATERVYVPDFLTELFRNPLDPGYAEAAARPRPTGGVGWSARLVSVVVLVALGFLFAVAYRQTVAEEPGRSQARAGLVEQINQRQQQSDELTTRADELRDEVTRLRGLALSGSDAARLRELEAGTGVGRVRGDGVVVRLADPPENPNAVTGGDGANGPDRVIYSDLQRVANGLWGVGAEAVAINGQRLTATSTIRSAGDAILVDFRPVTGPYEVSAIGGRDLRQRFEDSTTAALMRRVADTTGISFGVRTARELTLPAAAEPRLRYARPPVSPGPSPTAADERTSPESSDARTSPSPSGGGR
ncbi:MULTISPECIES: DUF881 domain-containing protein [Micromonospora]|uniref:Uncharacterized conserved protein YlxW, UPF0749 family n=1 Tax=Micromonospora yangpuensis TaxID=683228 RepID=A0A1C6UQH7_9ACTN|nr:DUF881 domain-containing protein [Micromonospora yangpuensis]GGM07579.1 membrane protein [Micromonospora yangpuensis]SCL56315.1 Uncharacterized conserved protein YlxW, UPF0749 family [Micromonospora yangpuensis]